MAFFFFYYSYYRGTKPRLILNLYTVEPQLTGRILTWNCASHINNLDFFRAILTWVSKVIRNVVGFLYFALWLAQKNLRYSLNQSDAKLTPIETWSTRFPFPRFGQLAWLYFEFSLVLKVFSFPLIGCCDSFGFCYTALNRKPLQLFYCHSLPHAFCISAPHQPRLDWQIWFAALGSYEYNPWFVHLVYRLLQGQQDVLDLLAKNPFPRKPPTYIRARHYKYHYTELPKNISSVSDILHNNRSVKSQD